ncbi:MAG: polysaccharide biosynthesis C-terminal domain-containing protein, partial [Clostridia bacterium]|nr:polysaccharide biosynthesis C-terminal domain-containing protein [Clostridia bacterium]
VLGMSVPMLFIPNSLIGSIAVVVAPEMSENFYAKRTELLRRDIERTLKSAVAIATVLIPVMFTLGEDIGKLFYASELSGVVIRRFSFMMLPMCISMITTTILNSLNYEVRTLIYFFAGAVAMIAIILIFTGLLGINAYMVGLTMSFVITAALNLHLLKNNCPDINYFGYLVKSVLICAFACAFGHLFGTLFDGVLPAVWKIILCGGIVSAFAILAFYGMEMVSARPFKKLFSRG